MYRQRLSLGGDQVLLYVLIRRDVACVAVPTFIRRRSICCFIYIYKHENHSERKIEIGYI